MTAKPNRPVQRWADPDSPEPAKRARLIQAIKDGTASSLIRERFGVSAARIAEIRAELAAKATKETA